MDVERRLEGDTSLQKAGIPQREDGKRESSKSSRKEQLVIWVQGTGSSSDL